MADESSRPIELTRLLDDLELMIHIADRMAEGQPYPPGIRKLRDSVERDLRDALRALNPR